MFVVAITVGLAEAIAEGADQVPKRWMSRTLSGFGLVWMWIETVVTAPLVTPALLLMRATAFRRLRRGLVGHLVSRPVIIGGGTLGEDGRFGLDEKGPAMRRLTRISVLPGDRPVFEMGNLIKLLLSPIPLPPRGIRRLFRPRQRFQLGLSSSNMAQLAEYLKIATTGLLVDMAEAGALDDAPRPRRPIAALHAICADPTLSTAVEIVGGEPLTALQIQRWYHHRAQRYLVDSAIASLEAHDVVRQWGETLDALETDPESLVGRIDWITKRVLIRAGEAEGLSQAALKKIDLRYHELGTGYFAELESAGLTRRLLDDDAVSRAVREPPGDTPAAARARLLRSLRDGDEPILVSWDRVRIGGRVGGRLGGKVIQLDDFRG
jgi:proteasome accessory factor A